MAVAWERGELSEEGQRYVTCTEDCRTISFWDAAARLFRIYVDHDIPGHEASVMRGTRAGVVRVHDLAVDLHLLRATLGGVDIALAPREWRCLEYLAQNADRWVSTRELTRAAYGSPTFDGLSENYGRTVVFQVRAKLGDRGEPVPGTNAGVRRHRYIHNRFRIGYRLCEESPV